MMHGMSIGTHEAADAECGAEAEGTEACWYKGVQRSATMESLLKMRTDRLLEHARRMLQLALSLQR